MIANQRRFVRLEEINEKTSLTEGDILDAVDSGQLTFSALVEAQNLGALIKRGESWKVAAVFDYNGMVKLFGNVSKQYSLALKPNDVSQLVVLQPEKICNWRSTVKEFGNVEESSFEYLKEAPSQPNQAVAAYTGLEVVPTMRNNVGKLTNSLTELMSKMAPDADFEELKSQCPETDAMRLQTKPIKVEPERLRLDLEDIAKVFGSDSVKSVSLTVKQLVTDSVKNITPTSPDKVSNVVLTHPIEQIVFRVLESNALIRADKVWNLLRKDIKLDTNRQYDTDSVITEMTQDDISWFGKGDTENSMSYESFRKNTVSDVRRFLKCQK